MPSTAFLTPLLFKISKLALFYQTTDDTITQLFPNTVSPRTHVSASTWWLPGELLPLHCKQLGPECQHLYFQDAGIETVIGLLCPHWSANLPQFAPTQPLHQVVADQLWRDLNRQLSTDGTANGSCLAVRQILVVQG